MHRECGTLANVNLAKQRAVGKMKATITQRFVSKKSQIPFDIDCDCEFIFFCKIEDGEWRAQFKKVMYLRDKIIPVNGRDIPEEMQDEEALKEFPEGYKYLALAQKSLGHPIDKHLAIAMGEYYEKFNEARGQWLKGEDIDLFWE